MLMVGVIHVVLVLKTDGNDSDHVDYSWSLVIFFEWRLEPIIDSGNLPIQVVSCVFGLEQFHCYYEAYRVINTISY